jgi:hypothetical protein
MINIAVQKLSTNSKDFGEIMKVDMGNIVAEKYAEIVRKNFKDLKCTEHPDATLHISITAVKGTVPIVEKKLFCCDKFKESILFTFE